MHALSNVLLALAEAGAQIRPTAISTILLGKKLGVSQQTASRWLRELQAGELVERKVKGKGMAIALTAKGRKELLLTWNALNKVFGVQMKGGLHGKAAHGLGEGAYYVRHYNAFFRKLLGFTAFPGTLNLEINEAEAAQFLEGIEKKEMREFQKKDRTFGALDCFPVLIGGKIRGAAVVPHRTTHAKNILEVIAPVYLRGKLGIKDGDVVVVSTGGT